MASGDKEESLRIPVLRMKSRQHPQPKVQTGHRITDGETECSRKRLADIYSGIRRVGGCEELGSWDRPSGALVSQQRKERKEESSWDGWCTQNRRETSYSLRD